MEELVVIIKAGLVILVCSVLLVTVMFVWDDDYFN